MTASHGGVVGRFLDNPRITNANICIGLALALDKASDPANSAGIAFWVTDRQAFDSFIVDARGHFAVLGHRGRKWATILSLRRTPLQENGVRWPLRLRAALNGRSAEFFVNGERLGRITGAPPANGSYLALIGIASVNGDVQWQARHLGANTVVSGP